MNSKRVGTVLLSVSLLSGVFAFGQATELALNSREARQELEVMKGILSTTLKYSLERGEETGFAGEEDILLAPGWGPSVEGFYLYGQGAVFVVSLPGFRVPGELRMLEFEMQGYETERLINERMIRQMQRTAERAARQARELARVESLAGKEAPPAPPKPEEPALPPTPPAPPAPPLPELEVDAEEMEARLAQIQEKMAQSKAESERRQAEYDEILEKTAESLLQAVAKHGDALTTVQPGEYINLILASSEFGREFRVRGAENGKARVLSVPRSVITDYKEGRLDFESFKKRVVRYEL